MAKYIFYIFIVMFFSYFIIKKTRYMLYIYIFSIQFESALFVDSVSSSISKIIFIAFLISFLFNFFNKHKIYLESKYLSKVFLILSLSAIFYILLNTIISINFNYSLEYLKMILQQFIMVIIVSSYLLNNSEEIFENCIKIYTVSSIIVSIIAIYKIFQNPQALLFSNERISPFGNPGEEAHFAAALMPSISYLIYKIINKGTRNKVALLVSLLILFTSIIFSQTRSAWVASLFIVFFFIVSYINNIENKLKAFLYIVFFFIIFLSILFFVLNYNRDILQLVLGIIENRSTNAIESGGSGRTQIWQYGIRIFKYNYFWGSGFFSFPVAFTKYFQEVNIKGVFNAIYAGRDAHNIFLSSLVEGGIIGFIIYALFYLYLIREAFTIKYSNIKIVIFSSFIAYLIIGFFLSITNRKYFWIIIALNVFISQKNKREKDD